MKRLFNIPYLLLLCLSIIGCGSNIPIIRAYPRPAEHTSYINSAPADIRGQYAASMSLYYQGRLDSAARGFRGTLTADSSFWGSYYYLGLINKDLGFYKTAINRFAKAIKLPVKNAALRSNIYLSMGECWELLGELPDAKMHYRAAINLNLESSPAKAGYKRVIQLIAQK